MLSNTYAKFYNQSENLAVDEVTVLFKGGIIFKQYITQSQRYTKIKINKLCDEMATLTICLYS